eukprot:3769812-Rhodomonas_salina.1
MADLGLRQTLIASMSAVGVVCAFVIVRALNKHTQFQNVTTGGNGNSNDAGDGYDDYNDDLSITTEIGSRYTAQ